MAVAQRLPFTFRQRQRRYPRPGDGSAHGQPMFRLLCLLLRLVALLLLLRLVWSL